MIAEAGLLWHPSSGGQEISRENRIVHSEVRIMGRLKEVRNYVDGELLKMPDADKRKGAYVHLYGVSLAATLLAEKRGKIRSSRILRRCFTIWPRMRADPMTITRTGDGACEGDSRRAQAYDAAGRDRGKSAPRSIITTISW